MANTAQELKSRHIVGKPVNFRFTGIQSQYNTRISTIQETPNQIILGLHDPASNIDFQMVIPVLGASDGLIQIEAKQLGKTNTSSVQIDRVTANLLGKLLKIHPNRFSQF